MKLLGKVSDGKGASEKISCALLAIPHILDKLYEQ